MASSQDHATEALTRWQALHAEGLAPEDRLECLMREFFAAPAPSDAEYEITLRHVAQAMAETA